MNKKRIFAIIFALITIAVTIFIFMNSMKDGEESAKQSGFFTDLAEKALNAVGLTPNRDTVSLFIRKLAHFSEYFVLSASAAVALYLGFNNRKAAIIAPLYAFSVAVCDEFIVQALTAGRGPAWTDVLIDTSGAVFAFSVFAVIIVFKESKKQKAF